ncbi:hypothetical protein TGRH88_059730 [Toxoplasma gondii]|uniref:Uncharacterized protein n=1 Tax=Toxoplasma gondii TaxID=5811 RepID=A0A7J6JT99_TOXGO|nr:hypothetical protein TGRH88_059730 [Toxoplasma gondii]
MPLLRTSQLQASVSVPDAFDDDEAVPLEQNYGTSISFDGPRCSATALWQSACLRFLDSVRLFTRSDSLKGRKTTERARPTQALRKRPLQCGLP